MSTDISKATLLLKHASVIRIFMEIATTPKVSAILTSDYYFSGEGYECKFYAQIGESAVLYLLVKDK